MCVCVHSYLSNGRIFFWKVVGQDFLHVERMTQEFLREHMFLIVREHDVGTTILKLIVS